jgi:hypothetical protein
LLTPRRVRQLTAEGVFTRARDPETGDTLRGRYELFPTLHAYIRFLRDGRLEDPDESNYVKARTSRMIVEARLTDLRYQTAVGKLFRAEESSSRLRQFSPVYAGSCCRSHHAVGDS